MLNMQWQRASWSAEWAFCPEAAKAAMIPVVVVPRLAPTLVLIIMIVMVVPKTPCYHMNHSIVALKSVESN